MDSNFNCGICRLPYKEPRLLSCLHSFCTKCLIAKNTRKSITFASKQISFQEDYGSHSVVDSSGSGYESEDSTFSNDIVKKSVQKIICPTCNDETMLTRGGVKSLPLNLKLEDKVNTLKSKIPLCEVCNMLITAFSKCEQCNLYMCSVCVDSHMKFGDTIGHTFLRLVPVNQELAQHKCKIHVQQELDYFCCNCNELLCSTCCMTMHKDHKYDTANQVAKNCSLAVSQAIEKAKPILKEGTRNVEVLRFLEAKINSRCTDIEREITDFIQGYKEALEKHGQVLIQEVNKIKESRIETLQEHCEGLSQNVGKVQNAIDFAEDLLSDGFPAELLTVSNLLLDQLDVTLNVDVNMIMMKISDCLKFLPEERAVNFGRYQVFGIVSTQSISPEHCTLQTDGLMNCRQHKTSYFMLTTKDCDNKVLGYGGEKINVELRYKDATRRLLPVYVNDEGDGSYQLSFTPDTAGSLSLSIKIRDINVQGSPFNVCVSTLRPHKGVFHCCTFCSSGGSKSAKCGCGCKMPGGYQGCGHGHVGHPGQRHWSCCGNILQNSECSRPISYQYSF